MSAYSYKQKPEPEKNEKGLRYITEKYCCKLCEYNGGYEYPHLNNNLYLHFQGFHKIENLDNFINLRVLYLESNLIEKIEGLEKLVSLSCLYLQNNYISKIENLDCLQSLVILNLSGNKIHTIEGLTNLIKLENFYIEKNYLQTQEDIRGVLNCPSLTLLDIQNNQIDENPDSVLNILERMPNLKVFYFKGNDCIKYIKNYRRTIILKLRRLTYLDDRPVKEEDRIGAKAYLEGGYKKEVEAREKYRNESEKTNKNYKQKKKFTKEELEERKKKAIENLRNQYEKRKNELEDKKRSLMKEYENFPEKRDKLNLELASVDYQIQENAELKEIQENNLNVENEKLNSEMFKYEDWMDKIIEKNVIDNYFDFPKALKLIKMEFKEKNVKNLDSFNILDLRNKWTELELKIFRKDDDGSYLIKKEDIFPTENKNNVIEKETNEKLNDEKNNGFKINIKEGDINEEEIDTSSKKITKSNLDEID